MRVVVLGAGGLLGRHCMRVFPQVTGYDHTACDVTNRFRVERAVEGAGLVVNCAAYTDADRAERDAEAARAVNALGAENVARAARRAGAALVHVSTDSVFDGEKQSPYEVGDPCRPLSVYGKTKLEGEERVREVGGRAYVVRVQGLYGDGGGNFASQVVRLVRSGEPMRIDDERRTQPTWARAAALQVEKLAREASPGTYHVSCSGETTWAGFARAVVDLLAQGEPPRMPRVLPVNWEAVPTGALRLAAKRPRNCVFSHKSLEDAGVMQVLGWRETLRTYLDVQSICLDYEKTR